MNAKLDNQAEGHQGTGDAGHRPTGVAHNLEDRRLVVVSEAGSVEREAGVAQRVVHVDGQHGLVSVCRPTLFLFRNAVRFDFRIAAGAKAKNQSNSGEGERREKYIGVNPPKCLILRLFSKVSDRPEGLNKPGGGQAAPANPDGPVTIFPTVGWGPATNHRICNPVFNDSCRPPLKIIPRITWFSGAFAALALSASAQIVEFRATINAEQEVPINASPAVGSAIMIYDVAANTFDLVLSIRNFSSALAASHIHEGLAGANGGVVTNLGGEAVYSRSGTTLTATFRGLTYGGTKLTLLQNGAYLNFHTAAFPGGEVRGQLIAQPKRLVARIDVAQEQAAFPANAAALGASNAFGAAVMSYDPGTNRMNLRVSLYNFTNTLTNSHFHDGAPGVSGPVATGLGAGTVASYFRDGNTITGTFLNIAYLGDPVRLLTGGTYLNFHSNTFTGGEIRGQVLASEELPASRVASVSSRGFVGTGNQVLIAGFNVIGSEPVRMLITAKGPSLSNFGVTGALTNPVLTLIDGNGRVMASNDDVGAATALPAPLSELNGLAGVPTNSVESALLVTLPAGNYSAVVSGGGGATGIALVEVTDLRNNVTIFLNRAASELDSGEILSEFSRDLQAAKQNPRLAAAKPTGRPVPEFCLPVAAAPGVPSALAQVR